MTKRQQGEYPVNELKTKVVYHYIDEKKGINIKSKEIFKITKKIRHYPFRKDNGDPKYRFQKITYVGFEKEEELPRGFLKSWKTGYGFTRVYNHIIYRLQDMFDFNEVIIQKKGRNRIDKIHRKLYICIDTLDNVYSDIASLLRKQKNEKEVLINNILLKIFPKEEFKDENMEKAKEYVPDSLSAFIHQYNYLNLSEKDINALLELISKDIPNYYIRHKIRILKTKKEIETVYIEDVIKQFRKLMSQKTETPHLEKKWQEFFEEHSWIFSQLFSVPVLILKDKAYVGGKGIENKNGEIADFIYRNELTNNVAIIEIKTHRSRLLKSNPYRGNDVFPMSDELSGGINQVLTQKDNLQKGFYALKSKSAQPFESYNPKCILIIGTIGDLSKEQQKAFELIRNNSKDVEIVTFDELFHKIKALSKIISGG